MQPDYIPAFDTRAKDGMGGSDPTTSATLQLPFYQRSTLSTVGQRTHTHKHSQSHAHPWPPPPAVSSTHKVRTQSRSHIMTSNTHTTHTSRQPARPKVATLCNRPLTHPQVPGPFKFSGLCQFVVALLYALPLQPTCKITTLHFQSYFDTQPLAAPVPGPHHSSVE